VENIFVLPGIPQYFEKKVMCQISVTTALVTILVLLRQMNAITKYFLTASKRSILRKIIIDTEEEALVQILDRLVQNNTLVKIGSYP
jgi:hypothetical protein